MKIRRGLAARLMLAARRQGSLHAWTHALAARLRSRAGDERLVAACDRVTAYCAPAARREQLRGLAGAAALLALGLLWRRRV